jgi:NAD(P)H-quinone oxidoreductase subunit 6
VNTEFLVFVVFALIAVTGAAAVPMAKNIFWSAMGLLAALLGVAGMYVLLSADFLAVVQLLIYIGGVLVLILFAIMLTSRIDGMEASPRSIGLGGASALFAATALLLSFVAIRAPWRVESSPKTFETTAAIGNGLLGTWLLPFEVASVVLLATLIGAITIGRKEIKTD